MQDRKFTFTAPVWLYSGNAAWHFVSVPKETSEQIEYYFAHAKRGWGSLPVIVTLGKTTWKTSIFPDKKTTTYLLPLKLKVREQEKITVGKEVEVSLKISE